MPAGPPSRPPRLKFSHLAAAFGVWLVVALVLFSSFFTNAAGPLDSVRTYLPWLHRAGGDSPHIHPWSFYLHRLLFFHVAKGPVWSEALILVLAVIGARAAFVRKGLADASASFVRFLALYTFALDRGLQPDCLQDPLVPAEFLARHDSAGGRRRRRGCSAVPGDGSCGSR